MRLRIGTTKLATKVTEATVPVIGSRSGSHPGHTAGYTRKANQQTDAEYVPAYTCNTLRSINPLRAF